MSTNGAAAVCSRSATHLVAPLHVCLHNNGPALARQARGKPTTPRHRIATHHRGTPTCFSSLATPSESRKAQDTRRQPRLHRDSTSGQLARAGQSVDGPRRTRVLLFSKLDLKSGRGILRRIRYNAHAIGKEAAQAMLPAKVQQAVFK